VLLTSILVNTLPAGFPPPPMPLQGVLLWLGIIAVQTLLIGWTTWMGVRGTIQSEQRRQAVTELQAALEENAALHAQLVTQAREAGVTQERQRLAHEMHDTLAQGLTGIITQLEAAGQAARAIPDPSPGRPELGRYLDNAARLARDSLTEARRSVNALRPEPLEGARLPEALAEVASRWSAVHGVAADVVTTGEARPMHPEVEITLLRTAQEALANVAKHAGATRVGLTLSYMEDLVTLDVRDDGVGFDPAAPPRNGDREAGGFGLTVMRQRVQHLDGTLEIESEPGAGTAIWAGLPAIARDGADA
jgi:signal transduction histidine kinase